jgi:hypothetical protein
VSIKLPWDQTPDEQDFERFMEGKPEYYRALSVLWGIPVAVSFESENQGSGDSTNTKMESIGK